MREIMIISATALVIAAIWVTTVVGGRSQQQPLALTATASDVMAVDVMGMMQKAKNLPEEQFDAH